MKFFIDTANIEEIKKGCALGMVDGVTTNPSLVSKENKELKDLIQEICKIINGPVSAEIISQDTKNIVRESRDLSKISNNIVIKIPLTEEGLKATSILSKEGIQTNITLCFSPLQALLAAKAGATYISPFIGRLDDISHIGIKLVEQILTIYNLYNFKTKVIVASIRNPLHVLNAALIGAHIATIPYKVLQQLVKHPLTDIGLKKFLSDWKNSPV